MSLPLLMLQLIGAATLLIWAVRMVRTGVERAYGAELRRGMHRAQKGKAKAAGIGTILAVALQSSTAVTILSTGFAASGILTVSTALALVLGADLGTAIVVQILSNDLDWLVPILITIGGWLFLKARDRNLVQIGRILMGIALILVSLDMIGQATAPIRDGELLGGADGLLSRDPFAAFLIGAVFTWFIHSSVASILLVVSLVSQGILSADAALFLVLGANFGAGLIAVGLSRGMEPAAQRVPIGNLLYRGGGAIVALLVLLAWPSLSDGLGPSPSRQVVNLHLFFNLALLLICLPSVALMERLLDWALSDASPGDGTLAQMSALDPEAISKPPVALMCATRELLQIGSHVENMLRRSIDAFSKADPSLINASREAKDSIRDQHASLKLYLAELNRTKLTESEASRSMELADYGVRLEHVSSIVSNNLLRLAEEKRDRNIVFSDSGQRDLEKLHMRVLSNFQLSLNVLVSGDHETARQLIEEKDKIRLIERKYVDRHMKRLREHVPASVESSDIHLEMIRDLKHINSLFTTVAVPVLAERGDLLKTRLAGA